jgi:peptidoglycan hydrolase CwlO-like protein
LGTFIFLIGLLLIIGAIVYLVVSIVKKKLNKKLLMYIGGAGILLFIVGASVPSGSAQTVSIDGKKVDYEKLTTEIKSKEKELASKKDDISNTQKKLDDLNKQYSDKENEIKVAMEIVDNKKKAEDELKSIQSDVESKKEEEKSVESKIKSKQKELASVQGQIQEKKKAPKILPAGKFTVGKDIPEGRYKVVPNSGNGNFFVNGGADVNIMLGHGELFQSEYVFYANDGDEIELTLSAKFIPVK